MIFAEADGAGDFVQIQVFHIMGVDVIHDGVELVHILLLLIYPHTWKEIDIFQMVGSQLYEQVQQQGVDSQLRKLVFVEIFVSHLYQNLVDVVVDIRIGGTGDEKGLRQNGLDSRKAVEPGDRGQVKHKYEACSRFRSGQGMQLSRRNHKDVARCDMKGFFLDCGVVPVFHRHKNLQGRMPVGFIIYRQVVVPDTDGGVQMILYQLLSRTQKKS